MEDLHDFNKLRPFESLFNSMRQSAQHSGKTFLLKYEEFLEFTKQTWCHYCHGPVDWTKHNLVTGTHRYNLDRKDNSIRIYRADLLVVCCKRCNRAKNRWYTYEEWYGMTAYLRAKQPVVASSLHS
jgi:hypothetical protein